MNRSALIIICDFLLISLLSLAKFEDIRTEPPSQPAASSQLDPGALTNLVDVMKQALEQERAAREQASRRLSAAEQALKEREQLLTNREEQIKTQQEKLQEMERRARELAAERKRLEQEQKQKEQQLQKLSSQQLEAQRRMMELQKELELAAQEATLTKSQVEAIQAELLARRQEAERLQEQIAKLSESKDMAESEKQRYAVELAKVQTQAKMVEQQLQQSRQQIQQISQEKAELRQHAEHLAQGVTQLAHQSAELNQKLEKSVQSLSAKSEQIKTQLSEAQEMSANQLFAKFKTNSLKAGFIARRSGFLGENRKEYALNTMLFTDGTNAFALFHIEQTPLAFSASGADWDSVTSSIGKGLDHFPISRLQFIAADPRILVAPIGERALTNLPVKPFLLAKDPARFQEAIVVNPEGRYYGEVAYRLDKENPAYLEVTRRSATGGLLSARMPSKGDFLFTKKGRLLGVMVNDKYCLALRQIRPTQTVPIGGAMGGVKTGALSQKVWERLQGMPQRFR